MKALERRQLLLEVLCERRHDKIGNLAFELGVNEKTIRRDIQELSLSYPIYTECSRGKAGVYIEENYYLGKQYLRPEEEELIQRLIAEKTGEDQARLIRIYKRFGRPKVNKNF